MCISADFDLRLFLMDFVFDGTRTCFTRAHGEVSKVFYMNCLLDTHPDSIQNQGKDEQRHSLADPTQVWGRHERGLGFSPGQSRCLLWPCMRAFSVYLLGGGQSERREHAGNF